MKFSKITAISRITNGVADRLTKELRINNGQLEIEGGTHLSHGIIESCTVDNLFEFNTVIESLTPYQCLVYGVSEYPKAKIVSRREKENTSGEAVISRTLDDIHWPTSSGIFLGDYDPPNKNDVLNMTELRDCLLKAMPELEYAPMLIRNSSSSWVNNGSEQVYGDGGKRFYIPFDTPSQSKVLAETLFDRCWLVGLGWMKISKDGRCLAKAINDKSVISPEHIDYAALLILGDGLEFSQQKQEYQIWYGGEKLRDVADFESLKREKDRNKNSKFSELFMLKDIKKLSKNDQDEVKQNQDDMIQKYKNKADETRQNWLSERAIDIKTRTSCSQSEAEEQALKASKSALLSDSWMLEFVQYRFCVCG